jgi:hypothetical protein
MLSMRVRQFVFVVLMVGALIAGRVTAGVRTSGIIGGATPFETAWYAYDSEVDGPTVVITGGIHGNEPAGARAARQIADWAVERGVLIVVPRCNEPALAARSRYMPGPEGDATNLNRHFPRSDAEATIHSDQASRIWAFVRSAEPDVVLDLHEGYGVRAAGSKSVGSSVLTWRDEDRQQQQVMLDAINATIDEANRKFTQINSIVDGSLARAAAVELDASAHILETTWADQPLSRRCRQHRVMVAALLEHLGMRSGDATSVVGEHEDRLAVALYDDVGTGGIDQARRFERILSRYRVERVSAADIRAGVLAQFDAVVFPGGSGSRQGKALAAEGRDAVRAFVKDGGVYIGVCAGAYLALHNYDWGLKIIGLDSIDRSHWRRGRGDVVIEWEPDASTCLGVAPTADEAEISFRQGPIMAASDDATALPHPTVLAWFRTGIGRHGSDPSVMLDTPAIVAADFGAGRVVLFSPHPEYTPGLESLLDAAIMRGVPSEAGAQLP